MTSPIHPKPAETPCDRLFPSAKDDAETVSYDGQTPQTRAPSYRLAFDDREFLLRDELRPVRLQLELLKPELVQLDHQIESTIVIFGSARIPDPVAARQRLAEVQEAARKSPEDPCSDHNVRIAERVVEKSRYYDEARRLGRIITEDPLSNHRQFVVVTGGGPGIMEAANRGAHDADGKSIGLNIVLPREQQPNPYITPDLCFQFHYFAIRKMHFLIRAAALVAFPGGYGTLDELFETLTLIQTGKVRPVPVILFGRDYWNRIVNFNAMIEEGTISEEDYDLIRYAETAPEAWRMILEYYDREPQ